MAKELDKLYNPQITEDKLYAFWQDGGYFNAEVDDSKPPFTIVIPPPNVTSHLHMGHAFDETLQDILIRYKRMKGFSALWVPGTDHAGIATQVKVEEALRAEGLTRYDLGREAFLKRVWEWKEMYGSRIVNQLKKLGSSCDWRRERFTMDDGCAKAVLEAFVHLYEKGLIYQGNRIINWCPKCTTALSDAEVDYVEEAGHLWHVRYPFADKEQKGEIIIATTRPETMLGDTAVAVHPDDERYKHLIGKKLILPLVGREIPIIADEYVEKDFGTGCVKITPCHDPNDFEVGKRHNLEEILILDENAVVNKNGGKYEGLDRNAARKAIVAELEAGGYLVKTEEYVHNVGKCYRCATTVEPITSKQWFVKMEPLKGAAIDAAKSGEIRFVPDRFTKTYLNWMDNVHDWCISRQLWWGHQIPAYTCDACEHLEVSRTDVTACPKCGGSVTRDPDVLDTWFSSGLWPFSVLGWPEKTPGFSYFYPTSVLVTGYDIIFFWVARMIFSAYEQIGERPFDTVFFHGMVRDNQGRKMSKSLGNGIDPLEIIEAYGADALRFTLVTGNSPGNDMRFYHERVESNRNFANKIWNASRFAMMYMETSDRALPDTLALEDKWVLSLLQSLVEEVTDNLESFELGVAAQKLYDFIYDILCDWYIELIKPRLTDKENPERSSNAQRVLLYVLSNTLALLHPFMPYITEEIWQALEISDKPLIVSAYPETDKTLLFPEEVQTMESIMDAIRAIRNRRQELNVPPSKKAALYIQTENSAPFESGVDFLKKLAYASDVTVSKEPPANAADMVIIVSGENRLFLPLAELVDFEKECARLAKEQEKLQAEIARIDAKLANAAFMAKAPEKVVKEEEQKRATYKATLEKVEESLRSMQK